MKNKLDILEKIETVEAPPFLFTRIQTKIQQQLADKVSKKEAIVYLAGILIIIALNVLAFQNKRASESDNDLISEMNLAPSNQVY
jgi:uncharacterized integral membrane protein